MKLTLNSGPKAGIGWRLAAVALVLGTILAAAPRVEAQENDALKILKTMSDYLTSQSGFLAEFDVDLEVITPDIQKIQFSSTGKVGLSRPDKLWAERRGGYSHAELVFDGKAVNTKTADMGWDPVAKIAYVPTFFKNTIIAYKVD